MNITNYYEQKRIFFSILIFSSIYIIFSTTYFNFDEALIYGANDGKTYMEISKNFPYFKENNLAVSHNQRFLIPYILGFINYISGVDLYLIYRISVFILFFLIIIFTIKILKFFKIKYFDILIALSFIVFNPYLLRYYISLPTLINDLTFILGSLIIIDGILKQKINIINIGLCISIFSRQTGIFFFISNYYK